MPANRCASPMDDQIIGYFVWSNDRAAPLVFFSADLTDSCALNDCMLNGQRERGVDGKCSRTVRKKKLVAIELCGALPFLET